MYKLLQYLKYIGLFFIFIIIISLLTSLFSLTNINSYFITKLGVILTAISFFIITSIASKSFKDKGYILGIKLSITFILFLLIINIIIFKSKINIDRIIYYLILITSGILGGSFGKNFKINFKHKK